MRMRFIGPAAGVAVGIAALMAGSALRRRLRRLALAAMATVASTGISPTCC